MPHGHFHLNKSQSLQQSDGETGDSASFYDSSRKSDEPRCLQLAKRNQWTAIDTYYQQIRKGAIRLAPDVKLDEELNPTDPVTKLNVLMMACRENQHGIIETLLDFGAANVTQQAHDGMTALHFAVGSACSDLLIRALLESGADPVVIGGPHQQLPLHIACQRQSTALIVAKMLLKRMPADTRLITDRDGHLPITYAVETCNPALIRELLSAYPREQATEWRDEKTGNTLLHLATLRKSPKSAQALVTFGRADVNAQNAKGQTPLHIAAQNCDEIMARCLHSLKANADINDKSEQTPLHIASMAGSAQIVQLMVDRMKADVQMRTTDGSTLMHLAAAAGHVGCVDAFVKRDVPLSMPNKAGILSLHLAAKNGHVDVVRKLIENGAPVNARTKDRLTAMHLAVMNNRPQVIQLLMGFGAGVDFKGGHAGEAPLHIAARTNGVECAKMLLLSGAVVNSTTGEEQETALHMASRRGYAQMVELLLEEGANTQLLSRNGESALHLAVRHCYYQIVKILIEHVERKYSNREVTHLVNLASSEGETSLHLAFDLDDRRVHYMLEDVDIVNILLKNGADPLAKTKYTIETPLHYAAMSGNINVTLELARFMGHNFTPVTNRQAKNGKSPLLTACDHGHVEIVDFLTQNNARVDLFDEMGLAALHLAAEKGFIDCCEVLLEKKAFINAKTRAGIAPLHLAAANGFKKLVVLFVEKYHATLDIASFDKKTALHLAAENGHKDVAQALVSLRANVNAVDSLGQTPVHLAAESDHSDVVKMFLKYKPELVFSATQDGMTCTHIAATKGSVAVIRELMRFNRSVVISAKNKAEDKPIHLAAAGGHGDVVKILIDAGSSPLDENADGMTCIHLAAKEGNSNVLGAIPSSVSWSLPSAKTGLTALHVAAFYAKVDMVRELLARVQPDVKTQEPAYYDVKDESLGKLILIDYGLTPLHVACYAGVDQVVRLLLNLPGVNAEARSAKIKTTALHLAAQTGSLSVASLLLSKSTQLLHKEDARGLKPLHLAARHGQYDMVASLVGQGADINSTDNHGWVPLHHACRTGHLSVVKLLLELGASVTSVTREDKVPLSLAAASAHIDVFMFLLGQEHDTDKLLQDRKFIVDLMKCGRMNKQQAVEEFVLASKSPLATSALLSHLFLKEAPANADFTKDLEAASRFCEKITSSLMSIAALQSSPSRILQAVDARGKPFIDTLLDDNLKTVVAESAVQRYLTEIWSGTLTWGNYRLIFLFFGFVLFPPLLLFFTLPFPHGYFKIPIVKFLAYLASHIQFIAILCTVCVIPLYPLPTRDSCLPTWNEYLLAVWLGGMLTAELTNPSNGGFSSFTKGTILGLSAAAFLLQILANVYDLESYEASILMYIRNIIFSLPAMLAVYFLIEFLSFNEKFGPMAIITSYIVSDSLIGTAIMLIFFIGWWLQLEAIYAPTCRDADLGLTADCICNVRVPDGYDQPFIAGGGDGLPGCRSYDDIISTLSTNFIGLYWALVKNGDWSSQPSVRNSGEWVTALIRFQYVIFHIIIVLTISTIIQATAADTFERMVRRSDLEWKFGRAKLIRNIIKTSPIPSPFNLFFKPFVYLKALIKRGSLLCTPFAFFYIGLEEEGGGVDEEMGLEKTHGTEQSFKSALYWSKVKGFIKRHSRVAALAEIPLVKRSAAAKAASKAEEILLADTKRETLKEVADWKLVIERYRELKREGDPEDKFIKELGCRLSELDEWQADLWEESAELEEDEEREIFRNWLIEEFKEVIKS